MNARNVNIVKILECIEEVIKICINIEKVISDLPSNGNEIYLDQHTNLKLQIEKWLKEFQYEKETNYIDTYEFLYKALNSSNFNTEDLDRWMNVAKEASTKIKQILSEEKYILTCKKVA